MKAIFHCSLFLIVLNVIVGCNSQSRDLPQNEQRVNSTKSELVGGGCDGCELMYVGMPSVMDAVDTSTGWYEAGQKLLVTGKVYKLDGKTPAANVILYYWHTDNQGTYSPGKGMDPNAKRHGHIRGWMKTDESGRYQLFTIRPAPYPRDNLPAHIHISVKEPNIANEYYIDEFVFDDDRLLTSAKRKAMENRGGNGVLRVLPKGDLQVAEHNIILGTNIPHYPEQSTKSSLLGLHIGDDCPSFIPFHAYGPNKGSRACPVCTFGRYHGIIYFVGNNPQWDEIKKWLSFLEMQSVTRGKYLKVYFVYGNDNSFNKDDRQRELQKLGEELSLKNIAVTYVPSLNDEECEVNLYKLNSSIENAFVVYRHRTVIDLYTNLHPTAENFNIISTTLDNSKGEFFELQEPTH